MPNKVEITEPAVNVVEVSTSPVTVEVTEKTNTVVVNASTRAVGSATIASGIDITNTIGDAIAGGTYASGTTLESIVRDLIAPFLEPTFSSISWSATGTHQASGESLLVETGLAATVTGITITWTNPENLNNDANLLIQDISAVPTNELVNQDISDYSALASPYTQSVNYSVPIATAVTTRNVKIQTGYLGDDGSGSNVALEKTVKIFHRERMYVLATTKYDVSGGLSALITGGDSVLSTLSLDPTSSEQVISVTCDANTAATNKYTWILIPSGHTLEEVAAEVGGLGVADYTDSWNLYDNSGNFFSYTVGTATPTYKAYRSKQPGAFDSDNTLKLTITR